MSDSSTERSRWAPHSLVLAAAWLVVTGALVVALSLGAREAVEHDPWSTALHVGYLAALLWYLSRTGSPLEKLSAAGPSWVRHSRIGQFLSVMALALLLAITILSDDGSDIVLIVLMVATLWILIVWRREIRLRRGVVGFALAMTAFLAGTPFRDKDVVSGIGLVLLPAFVLPMFVAGGLLIERTGFSGSQLHLGRFMASAASFLCGCALFVPLGLINAVGDPPGTSFAWITEVWMPLSLPLFSSIAEEAWFRLLLVTLCYYLLRPVFEKSPGVAVICAVLFSAIIFGLAHGRSLDRLLTTGLLYGLPMAVVFARRDWEHAIGAHYMINMIPWLRVYLEN